MLVLASTSIYRRALLTRLGLRFDVARPEVDETPLLNESPMAQAQRLAEAKARAVAERFRDAWVIGSDQVAELNGQSLGKPGGFERAADQLAAASGQRVHFHTAVSVFRNSDRRTMRFCDLTVVQFRTLASADIERYLHAEQPYDCAGSFKSEGLGISLFESIESRDPTALIGLPLIALAKALRQAGFTLP
ncbi:MAG TPA: Maf family nucleotide pyrophosphatase [Arenimonas sp.]|uniref:Maf family protein n=1 Tax=Arenimonas sp. TaxID=1872635 RepID=UPI002B9FF61F|nr:Maf family nucleotide pyrophosphatase [Arenimonas sp.]HMB56026.1 Maf family nucleotide pyrophosphatase [Arenimonas sp.]